MDCISGTLALIALLREALTKSGVVVAKTRVPVNDVRGAAGFGEVFSAVATAVGFGVVSRISSAGCGVSKAIGFSAIC